MRILPFLATLFISCVVHGFEQNELDLLRRNNMNTTEVLLHMDHWGVKPSSEVDVPQYKGQAKSMIDWENIDSNRWLDFNRWKEELSIKDSTPDWQIKLRDSKYSELVGRVIQCLKDCQKYSRSGQSSAQYTSEINEGDEISTGKDSYAWIFLRDGSLLRISPKSSISFLEINLSQDKVFFLARLNHGHIYFEHRKVGVFPMVNRTETDLAMYPLLEKTANRSYFARKEYQKLDKRQRLLYTLEKNPGHVAQYLGINKMLEEQSKLLQKRETEFFVFTANATFLMKNPIFHLFHETTGQSLVKLKDSIEHFNSTDPRSSSGEVFFRGYNNKSFKELAINKWQAVDPEGLSITPLAESTPMKPLEYLVKRIPSIHYARELFLRKYSSFLSKDGWSKKLLAKEHGLRLWKSAKKEELELRKKFLFERIRRVETTNLRSIKKVFKDKKLQGLTKDYYLEALSRTLMALENLNDYNSQVVKETTETEYYLWILNNAEDFVPTYIR